MINWSLYKGKDNSVSWLAYESFYKKIYEAGYKLLSEYKGVNFEVKLQCDKGHEYITTPAMFREGRRCGVCTKIKRDNVKVKFKELVEEKGHKLLSEYINLHTKVKIRCDKGHIYEMTPSCFKDGNGCVVCREEKKNEIKINFKKLVESEGHKLLSEYINLHTEVEVECDKGHIYKTTPGRFKQGGRCTECNSKSKGEDRAYRLLKELDFDFETQKTFDGMVSRGRLSYDFYIPSLNLAIEINGIQHYEAVEFFGGELQFKKQQKHDEIKREYAKNNGITLLEVPYYGRKYNIKYVEKYIRSYFDELLAV